MSSDTAMTDLMGGSIIDCAIARQSVFMSTTTRMRVFEDNSHDDMLVTMTFAPVQAPILIRPEPLVEWERCSVLPPVEGDPEWRFALASIGVNDLLCEASDVIESHLRAGDVVATELESSTQSDKPSTEWKANERAKLNSALRFSIMKRDGFRCQLCGRDASEDNNVRLEVDHIVPVARWGRTEEGNLQTLCRECNRGKSDNETNP